jgi:hypothetical protein
MEGDNKPVRRLTLRQLLNQAEKCTANLIENCKVQFMQQAAEFRGLTRPVRRRSQFPSMMAVQNSLRKFEHASDELNRLISFLHEHLEAIRDHANRERVNRL